VFALRLAGQDAETQIRSEVDRIEHSLRENTIADIRSKANTEELMKQVRDATAQHRVFQSLEYLAELHSFLGGVRNSVEESGSPAFDARWARVNGDLTTLLRQVRNTNWNQAQNGLRALAESALGTVGPLLSGSRGFAESGSVADGLFYLGQAQGEGEFAKFCASLNLVRTGRAISARSILPELLTLQEKVNAAFVPPRSIEQHSRFIALNATLKMARELDAAGSHAGALYQYLDAVRLYGLFDASGLDDSSKKELKEKVGALRTQLTSSKNDDSVAAIFVERAESLIAGAANAEEWRAASVIAGQVIPAYFDARKPSAGTVRPPHKTVQLTLVRWPFT